MIELSIMRCHLRDLMMISKIVASDDLNIGPLKLPRRMEFWPVRGGTLHPRIYISRDNSAFMEVEGHNLRREHVNSIVRHRALRASDFFIHDILVAHDIPVDDIRIGKEELYLVQGWYII